MDEPTAKAWFAPKRYGYGATPITWQGWATILLFVALLILDIALVAGAARWVCAVLLVVAYIGVTYRKTAGAWRWRWGRRDGA